MAKHLKRRKQRPWLRRCNISGLVIFNSEIDAKIALAGRIRKESGEKRYFRCGSHYHLSAQEKNKGVASQSLE
jgi:hypothetical protein